MKITWATRFTLLRILLIAPFISCMLKINDPHFSPEWRGLLRHLATAIFLVMAVSDGIDGYVARRRNQITKLGAFLDPLADKLLITSACLLLASKTAHVDGFLLPTTVTVLIVGKDLILTIGFVIVYLITFQTRVEPVLIGKTTTALQLIMVAAVLVAPEMTAVFPPWRRLLPVLWWSAAGTAVWATLVYIRNGTRYIEQYERAQANKH